AAMIMARANRAAEAKAVAELAPFPKTGLRPHRHRQPHGPGALGQPERHETPDPARSDAVESRFHGARPRVGQRLYSRRARARHGFGHTSQVSSSNDSDNPVAGDQPPAHRLLGQDGGPRRVVPAGQGAVLPLAERPVPGQRLLRAAQPATCSTPSATSASEIVNRSAWESVLMTGTEAAIAGAVASPQCFPADPAVELWLPPFSISRRRR